MLRSLLFTAALLGPTAAVAAPDAGDDRPRRHRDHDARRAHARPLAVPGHRRPPVHTVTRSTTVVVTPPPRVQVTHRAAPPPPEPAPAPEPHPQSSARNQAFALGVRLGSQVGGYRDGGTWGDFELGVLARYRPIQWVALELAVSHADEAWRKESLRRHTSGSASVLAYITPWNRVSPYVLGGLTVTGQELNVTTETRNGTLVTKEKDLIFGPHGGLGLEVGLGGGWALDFEARGVGYVNAQDTASGFPAAFHGNVGVVAHF